MNELRTQLIPILEKWLRDSGLNEVANLLAKSEPELYRLAQELYYWQHGGKNFTAQLFSLINKADSYNRDKLMTAFPLEVLTYKLWETCPTPEGFYREMGVKTA